MKKLKVSVRTMVESVIQEGDLYSQSGYDVLNDAANAHRLIQKSAGDGYQAEVTVKLELQSESIHLEISGRIDGLIILEGETVTVQEIKSISPQAEFPHETANRAYWAQAICYGHMLCEKEGYESLIIQLLYVRRKKRETNSYSRIMTAKELKTAFFEIADIFLSRCEKEFLRKQRRDESTANISFPFDGYRAGQREMMRYSYLTIMEGKRAFVEAPTGTGKTAASVYPAIHALKEGGAEQIFYLTSRTTVAKSVVDLLKTLSEKGLRAKAIHISAKDKMCMLEKRDCNPAVCPYAQGYFDKIAIVLEEMIESGDIFTMAESKEVAQNYCVCPFELSLDLSLMCDVIVCDYNYVFDPGAQLKRFFMRSGKHALLIDEAHNLPQRSRDMFTAMLSQKSLADLRKAVGGTGGRGNSGKKTLLFRTLAKFCAAFNKLAEYDEVQEKIPPGFLDAAKACSEVLQEYVPTGAVYDSALMDCMFELMFFCKIAESYDERYVTRLIRHGNSRRSTDVQLLCLDASKELAKVYDKCTSAFFFSATLTPFEYYKSTCGADYNDTHISLPSPFPRENLFVCGVPISVTYNSREVNMPAVIGAIHSMISAKKGNYIAFFPSYAYMRQAHEAFCAAYPDVDCFIQRSEMSEEDRETFIERFVENGSVLAFCVLGGIFSQSVDLPGDRLIGAAVVSVGLPQISGEVMALKNYYDERGRDGFGHALRFPGMCKVLQAAGRVIRSETDRGVVLLIDSRYGGEEYAALLPAHFHPIPLIAASDIKSELTAFWECEEMTSGKE